LPIIEVLRDSLVKSKAMISVRYTSTGVAFAVKVQPRARKNAITGVVGDALKLALTAPPVDGRANEACIEFFANLLDLPRSSVTIASGETSRNKVIRVAGLSADEVQRRLRT
jgi:hypothetical protein